MADCSVVPLIPSLFCSCPSQNNTRFLFTPKSILPYFLFQIDYKNSKIEENLFIIEEKGLLLNKKNDENNILQEKNIELMEKYQKLQNENSEVTSNREKPNLREKELLLTTAALESTVIHLNLAV